MITDDRVVELAHEALIREWPRLRGWLDEDREGLRLHRRLTEAAEGWESHGRDDGDTYRGLRLSQLLNWAAAHPGELSRVEQAFLDVSQSQAQQEEMERQAAQQRELKAAQELAETQRTAAAQLRRRAIYLGGAFILAIIMAGIALMQGDQARKAAVTAQVERRISYARELSAAAVNSLETDPERSILLALQAVSTTRSTDGIILPEAEEALHRSILASQVRLTLSGLNEWVLSTTFSPDGKSLAAIGVDGTVLKWDAFTGAEQLRIPGSTIPGDEIGMQRIAFHPDGKHLATGDGKLVKIWDGSSGAEILTLSGHPGEVWAVVYSPDGSRVASGGFDGSVRLWDAVTGKELFVLNGHEDAVEGLAFRPDGSQLASVGDDQAVRIWDVLSGTLAAQRADFDGPVDSVTYSPDGKSLAITTSSGLYVWNADDLRGDARLSIFESATNAAFSPDGTRLAAITGSVARLWDAQTGRELFTLAGHSGWVIDLAFSPDGKRMATTSFDQTVKVWSIAPGEELITLAGKGDSVVYSQDGSLMATDGADGSASIWDAFSGELLHTLAGHTAPVMGVAFSPNGKRLATASLDTSTKIWDTANGELVLTLMGHAVGVRDVTFSPDGKRIATAGFDQTARIWDVETGKELLNSADTRDWSLVWLSARTGGCWEHPAPTRPRRYGMPRPGACF